MLDKMKAVAYLRFSSEMQNENSIEGQRRVVQKFAKEQGFEIDHEYIDRAMSGRNDKRDEFKRMITDCKTHQFQCVLVYKLDRFCRNERLHRKYEDILEENGVLLISATEAVNEKSLGEKIMKSMMVILNEQESIKISENVSRGKKEVAYKSQWCGGTPPLGFDVDKSTKKLVINPFEAKTVRYAFKLRSQGFSYAYIIAKLNKKNYKTKRGNEFLKNSLTELFHNIKYKGTYEYNRAVSKSVDGTFNRHKSKGQNEIIRIDGGCPAIVSAEIWDKVQTFHKRETVDKKPKGDYLLSGLVICKCGTKMQVNRRNNRNKEYISFFCPNHKQKKNCNAKEIDMNLLEEFVLLELSKHIFCDKMINVFLNDFEFLNSKKRKASKKIIADIKHQLKANEQKINNCVTKIEEGCNDTLSKKLEQRVDELERENGKMNKKVKRLKKEQTVTPTIEQVKALKGSLIPYMQDNVNLPIRKAFLQQVIEKIIITNDDVEVIFQI